MNRTSKLPLYLLGCILAALSLAGCSFLGVATESYVEDRVEAVDDARIETAAAIVEPLEPIVPGITSYARERARGVEVREPPPPDESFPWLEVVGIVGAAFGVSVPAAVGATNRIRDQRRRQLNEATNLAEASRKGYFVDATVPPASGATT